LKTKKFKHVCSFSDKAPDGEAGAWALLLWNRVEWIKQLSKSRWWNSLEQSQEL
jgi:hypothetical protein